MISLLVVNFRSARLAAEAIRTARKSTSMPLQVVVVDNSVDPAEAEALRPHADALVVSASNRGYAAAINAGRPLCDGEVIVISNPDVTFAAGAIDRLKDALRSAAVAGPAMYWDDAHAWMLPPGDLGTGWENVDAILASRSRAWRQQWDRRRFLKRVAFWSQRQTIATRMLSGAVMAVRAASFDRVGGLDERFALYFEENDFLRQMAALRERIVYVPEARCRHIYNQSAGQVSEIAASRYAESRLRYLEKWNGPLAARVMNRLERPLPPQEGIVDGWPPAIERPGLVVEASPLPSFATAAGHFAGPGEVSVPPEILGSLTAPLFLRLVVRATGDVLGTYRINA